MTIVEYEADTVRKTIGVRTSKKSDCMSAACLPTHQLCGNSCATID